MHLDGWKQWKPNLTSVWGVQHPNTGQNIQQPYPQSQVGCKGFIESCKGLPKSDNLYETKNISPLCFYNLTLKIWRLDPAQIEKQQYLKRYKCLKTSITSFSRRFLLIRFEQKLTHCVIIKSISKVLTWNWFLKIIS